MKLLLTSEGFTNKSIANALLELTGKPFKELKLAFIPTAANVEKGDKGWLIDDLSNCQKLGFSEIDIVDISALPQDIWEPKLRSADVLMFGGGNTFHLMYWIKKTGLDKMLVDLLETRVYVGVSAGSMVVAKNLSLSQSVRLYYEGGVGKNREEKAMGFVDFHVRPHFNSKDFPNVRAKNIREMAKEVEGAIYALDDNSAIKVDGNKITVVSEGEWEKFN